MRQNPILGIHSRHFYGPKNVTPILTPVMISVFALVLSATPCAADPAPTESVKSTITELIDILDNEELKKPDRSEDRRREIERVVKQRVSYEEMAKRSLGAPWSELSEVDRQEFVDLFVQLLRDTFAGRINDHSDEQVIFLGEQREDSFAEVRTKLQGQKVETPLDFRLVHQSGDWFVYDVVIDGASIVSNYRAQFAKVIQEISYMGLVTKMKQKAVAVKRFEKTARQ